MRSYIQTRPQPPPIEIDYCDDDDDDGDDDDDYFHNVEYKPLVVWLLQSFPDLRWWQTKMNIPGHKYSLNICVQVSDSQTRNPISYPGLLPHNTPSLPRHDKIILAI